MKTIKVLIPASLHPNPRFAQALFEQALPFKPKVEVRRDRYTRKSKHRNRAE
jgi:hypothetical protein